MTSSLAALLLVFTVSIAHADDPMPIEEASPAASESTTMAVPFEPIDPPGLPGENEPARAPVTAPAPAPAKVTRARMSSQPARPRLKDDGDSRLEKKEDVVAGGKHWRIKTAQGAVHVWVPANYDRETAGTVVYVHGYWTDADGAWKDHELARQFRASRQNALFIVPDAPSNNDEQVMWPALTDLRRAVTRANIKLPDGPVIVIGHSGAFRTVMQWVDHRAVDQIILLDAMYAGERAFDEFIKTGKRADDHKLIVVAASTAQGSRAFTNKYKFSVAREKVPADLNGFAKRERSAKLLYIHSQYEHMAIVTSKKVIPLLLRVTPLKAL
ncbi:MAG: hypothetical protein JWP01_614 [Myxococcales bacterium]|nr:hypothetical protein [Myxococcales bacterium]